MGIVVSKSVGRKQRSLCLSSVSGYCGLFYQRFFHRGAWRLTKHPWVPDATLRESSPVTPPARPPARRAMPASCVCDCCGGRLKLCKNVAVAGRLCGDCSGRALCGGTAYTAGCARCQKSREKLREQQQKLGKGYQHGLAEWEAARNPGTPRGAAKPCLKATPKKGGSGTKRAAGGTPTPAKGTQKRSKSVPAQPRRLFEESAGGGEDRREQEHKLWLADQLLSAWEEEGHKEGYAAAVFE